MFNDEPLHPFRKRKQRLDTGLAIEYGLLAVVIAINVVIIVMQWRSFTLLGGVSELCSPI
jgi:hypothetical protein